MYKKNKSEPRIDPCGAPHTISLWVEVVLLSVIRGNPNKIGNSILKIEF